MMNESQPINTEPPQEEKGIEPDNLEKSAIDISETEHQAEDLSKPDEIDSTNTLDPAQTQPVKILKPSRMGFLLRMVIILAALALGIFAGYQEGVRERLNAQKSLITTQLADQFALAEKDIEEGRYDVASQRLTFIINQDPGFPGASQKLTDVMVKMAITPSPVPTDTPTVTPTPDTRSQDAIYAQAQQQLTAKEWTGLMTSLDSLRKADPNFKAVNIDGMYYTALRNRGVDQILGVGAYKTTNLEGGIFDMTLAARFGPLDGYALGLQSAARLYITGASFWDVNWPKAVEIFRQVAQMYPNLRDASNSLATDRYYQALLKYGDQLASALKPKDQCAALDIWSEANNIKPLNAEYANKFSTLNSNCNPPTAAPPVEFPTPEVIQTGVPTPEVIQTPVPKP